MSSIDVKEYKIPKKDPESSLEHPFMDESLKSIDRTSSSRTTTSGYSSGYRHNPKDEPRQSSSEDRPSSTIRNTSGALSDYRTTFKTPVKGEPRQPLAGDHHASSTKDLSSGYSSHYKETSRNLAIDKLKSSCSGYVTEPRSSVQPCPKRTQTSELQDEDDFLQGPLSILTRAVRGEHKVLISLRNNKKLLPQRIVAFDRHFNMILEDVKEVWVTKSPLERKKVKKEEKLPEKEPEIIIEDDDVQIMDISGTLMKEESVSEIKKETPGNSKTTLEMQRTKKMDRFVKKMFLRGDSVILCVAHSKKKK